MGIDAGIVVVKQITDEQKWFQAMDRIRKMFGQADYFEILPHFNKEDFNEVSMKKFNLDEDMNFSSNGFQTIDWHWREFPHQKDLSTLKLELSELKKKKEEFEKDERKYFDKYDQKDLENLTKAVEFKKNCDKESKELFQNSLCCGPPTLFKFAIGEHPCLPVFGRHFKNCVSKISYGPGQVEHFEHDKDLEEIFRILKEYFPTNIAYWSELNEERLEKLEESGFYKLDLNPWISKEIFYEDAKEVFSTPIHDKGKFLEARERFLSILYPSRNIIPSTSVFDCFDPSTPIFDPKFTNLSRPSAKTSSADVEKPIASTSNKNEGKTSKHQQKMKKDETNPEANIESESNCQNDIENASSLLGAASLVQKGNVNV